MHEPMTTPMWDRTQSTSASIISHHPTLGTIQQDFAQGASPKSLTKDRRSHSRIARRNKRVYQGVQPTRILIRETIIGDICLRGTFQLSKTRILVSKELSSTIISLCLQTQSRTHSRRTLCYPSVGEDNNAQSS